MNKKPLINEVSEGMQKRVPIWFMRQAGRYMTEYREEKKKHRSFLEMCLNSTAVKEIAMQPLARFSLDAVIIFSDILIVPFALGLNLEFRKKEGPVFLSHNLEDRISQIEKRIETNDIYSKVYEGISKICYEVNSNHKDKAIIGFAGSPFTIACYAIQGRGSRDFHEVRRLYFNDRKKFLKILSILTDETEKYLKGQIDQGVEIIKLFDSWAGILGEDEFEELVIKPTQTIVRKLRDYKKDIIINTFPRGAGIKYKKFIEKVNTDIIAIDHTIPREWARDNLQSKVVIQGNLDNVILTAENSSIKIEAEKILRVFSKGRFIFNLGHGILPDSKINKIEELIKTVKSYDRAG